MPNVVLRPLTLADSDAVARLYRVSYDQRLPWLAGRHTPEQDRWFFRERVFATSSITGADVDGALAGFIALREDWIDQLYVLPAMQGVGAGSGLLAHAKARSDRLRLWAFQRNAKARAFYERRGFGLVRETDGADNEEREPHALYLWSRGQPCS
jgi:GNAT superfamily N-acetyltransferase